MSYVRRRKVKIPALLALIAIVVVVLGLGVFAFNKFISPYPKEMTAKIKENNGAGKYSLKKKVINDDYYVLHYPKTGHKELDQWISSEMDSTLNEFPKTFDSESEVKHEVKQLFKSNESLDNFTSVVLETYVDGTLTKTLARTYDKSTKQLVSANLLNDKARRVVIHNLQNPEIKPELDRETFIKETMIEEDFNNLYLDGGNLTFYLTNSSYDVNLKDNTDYLSADFGSLKQGDEKNVPSTYIDYGYNAEEKMIAITFDDGPYTPNSYKIMELFEKYDGHATFFLLGSRIEGDEQTLIDMLDRGHQVASHSYDHPNFNDMTVEEVKKQLDDTSKEIERATGYNGIIQVRPPYGAIMETTRRKLDYTFINWSIDTEDWLSRNPQSICDITLQYAEDGDIVLMHELYETTVEALNCVLPKLKEQGYKFVTVKELLEAKGNDVKFGQLYFDAN